MAKNDPVDLGMRGGQIRDVRPGLAASHHHHEPAAIELLARLELRGMDDLRRVVYAADFWHVRLDVQPGADGNGIAVPPQQASIRLVLEDVAAAAPSRDRKHARTELDVRPQVEVGTILSQVLYVLGRGKEVFRAGMAKIGKAGELLGRDELCVSVSILASLAIARRTSASSYARARNVPPTSVWYSNSTASTGWQSSARCASHRYFRVASPDGPPPMMATLMMARSVRSASYLSLQSATTASNKRPTTLSHCEWRSAGSGAHGPSISH